MPRYRREGVVNIAHFEAASPECAHNGCLCMFGNIVAREGLARWRLPMPRYFFDVEDGHRLFDSSGFVCDDDTAAIIKAAVLAIGVSLDKPRDDPERRIAVINNAGHEIGTVPVYSKPSYKNPAK
jgi:hypothetical protein